MRSDAFFAALDRKDSARDVFGRSLVLGGEFSFCYIDGNHAYEYARRDLENASRYLVPEGFILLDDSQDGGPFGSSQLMGEIKRDPRSRIVEKNPNYLLQKRG